MRSFRWVMSLVALLAMAPSAVAAVTADALADADVVVDSDATLSDGDRQRLQGAADDLKAKGFPVKFVITETSDSNRDLTAAKLRSDLGKKLGSIDNIDGVFIIAPRQLGIDADVFPQEKQAAFEAERSTLTDDPIAGTINIAKRFQKLDEAALLPGEKLPEESFNWLLFIVLPALLILGGLFAIFRIRRAVARGDEARGTPVSDRADAPDDDPGAESETPNT